MSTRKGYTDISDLISDIADEINSTLNSRQADKYFDGIVLIYSFIENILKWLVYIKLLWQKSTHVLRDREVNIVRKYCKSLSFCNAQQMALSLDVINWRLYQKIDVVRKERNDLVHQLWLYTHRSNRLVLRKKLEKLAGVANLLLEAFNSLVEEIGVDEVLEQFL